MSRSFASTFGAPLGAARRLHVPLILALCVLIYWPALGRAGFSGSEGQRVIPGWTMAESGDWSRVTLFGADYVRKPPGMPWAIAASARLFGESEWSARAVSAGACTLAALLAYFFASRWYGRGAGIAAGIAQAVMPAFWWGPGRSAEIEALNMGATQAAIFGLLQLFVSPAAGTRSIVRAGVLVVATAAAVAGMIIAKGPASAPCVAALPVAACLGWRSFRPLARAGAWVAIGLGIGAAWLALGPYLQQRSLPGAVGEGMDRFMWNASTVRSILLLAPVTFAVHMPASLALLFPWGPDARSEARDTVLQRTDPGYLLARTLAFAWILSLLVFTAAGVDNHRYTLPSAVLLPPLVAYVARGCLLRTRGIDMGFDAPRRVWAARLSFGNPVLLAAVLVVLGVMYARWFDGSREKQTGRPAGESLAPLVAGREVWGNDAIEAKPEVLLYAQRALARSGGMVRVRWMKPALERTDAPPPGVLLLLRTDARSNERERYGAKFGARLTTIARAEAGAWTFELCEVAPAP